MAAILVADETGDTVGASRPPRRKLATLREARTLMVRAHRRAREARLAHTLGRCGRLDRTPCGQLSGLTRPRFLTFPGKIAGRAAPRLQPVYCLPQIMLRRTAVVSKP